MATTLTSFYPGIRVHIPSCPVSLLEYYTRETIREFCKETLIHQAWCDYNDLAVNTRSYTIAPPSDTLLVRAIYGKIKHTASNGTITATTAADPIVLTSTDHGLVVGSMVYIAGLSEMTELNDLTHTVSVIDDDDNFSIDIDGSAYTPETTGGTWNSVSAYTNLPAKTEGYLDIESPDWRIDGQGTNYEFHCPDTVTAELTWNPAEAVPNGLRIFAVLQPTPTASTVDDVIYNDWYSAIEAGTIGRLLAIPGKDWTDLKSASIYLATFHAAKREALGDRLAGNTHRAVGVQGNIGAYT